MNKKHLIRNFLLGIFFIHFCLIIFYNFSPNNPIVNKYIRPFFDQNWQFFAPDPPTTSKHIFFRFKSKKNNEWSIWINPGYQSHQVFDYNRFSYHGKLVHLNAAICHYLNQEIYKIKCSEFYLKSTPFNCKNEIKKQLIKSDLVNSLSVYLKTWINWQYKLNPIAIESVLFTKNNYSNKTEITILPIIK